MFELELFLLALSFYTRLPVPKGLDYSRLPQASIYLPLIGWLTGGLSGLCFYWANLWWPQAVAAILALICGILLTGAFHEDGFADVCDGFGGGYGKERILEIMKDSRIGVYGALGLVLIMVLKISLLASMEAGQVPAMLIAAHSLSRLPPIVIMSRYDYARVASSKSKNAAIKLGFPELLIVSVIAALPLIFLPPLCAVAVPVLGLITWRLGRYFYQHIGGYTGDCLGASQQITEVAFYMVVSGVWKYI